MPKETLGTLREEGGCPFVGASRALFQSFPLTSSGRHNGKKNPFLSFCTPSTWLVWEIFQLSEPWTER